MPSPLWANSMIKQTESMLKNPTVPDKWIYFLRPEESKIKTFCAFCSRPFEGIAIDKSTGMGIKAWEVYASCHNQKIGILITEELLEAAMIVSIRWDIQKGLQPVIHSQANKRDRLTNTMFNIEHQVRKAKEKILTQFYGRGQAVISATVEPVKIEKEKGRKIILD